MPPRNKKPLFNLQVKIDPAVSKEIRRASREFFPNEISFILLGHRRKTFYHITNAISISLGDENSLNITTLDRIHSIQVAQGMGLTVLGDLHSHTVDLEKELDCRHDFPSGTDWLNSTPGLLEAICFVKKYRSGKMRSWITFWPGGVSPLKTV